MHEPTDGRSHHHAGHDRVDLSLRGRRQGVVGSEHALAGEFALTGHGFTKRGKRTDESMPSRIAIAAVTRYERRSPGGRAVSRVPIHATNDANQIGTRVGKLTQARSSPGRNRG